MGRKCIDLSGIRFGNLTAINRTGTDKHGEALWFCKCDCGNDHIATAGNLRKGNTKSCGCLSIALSSERFIAYNEKQREIKRQRKPQYIASLSYGKDSIAMLEVIKQHGMPLDRIIHIELMATETVSADLPQVIEFKRKADRIIAERYGIEVEHIKAKRTFEEHFYRRRGESSKIDGIRGFPALGGCWVSWQLKLSPLRKIERGNISYIGIAANEPDRMAQLNENKRSPLVEHGVTETQALEICESLGLLSPIYSQITRSGCWFCPYQNTEQLRLLRKQCPDLWAMLLKWDADSPVPFKADGRSVKDYDVRFALEDSGELNTEKRFLWNDVLGVI